jgi:hypothetical protein
MSKIDFQNGFIAGFSSKGKTIQKQVKVSSEVLSVIYPIEGDIIKATLSNDVQATADMYYPVKLPDSYVKDAIYYLPEDSTFNTSLRFIVSEVDETTQGVYYRYTGDMTEINIVAVFDGENTPNFEANTDIFDDGRLVYYAEVPFDGELENLAVYTIIIDEGTENEFTQKVFTVMGSDGLSGVSFLDSPFLLLKTEGILGLILFEEKFSGMHTIKIKKNAEDSYPRYAVRVSEPTYSSIDIIVLDRGVSEQCVIQVLDSSGKILSNRTFNLEVIYEGFSEAVLYDFSDDFYSKIDSGEEITLKIIDSSNIEIVSSSIFTKSNLVWFIGGESEFTSIDCYCLGNEYIAPSKL